jgi:N-acyl-D-amino-acid deacylase
MKLDVAAAFVASVVALLLSAPAPAQAQEHFDVLLRGGQVIDGTGNPWFYAAVGVRDGRIVAVGPLEGATADRVVDATGKVVTPGFIDLHSHAGDGERSLGSDDPLDRGAPNLVAQGATTLVVNQDGRSPWPLRDQRSSFENRGIGPNAALLVGHGAVRDRVMGDDYRRAATPDEVRSMGALVLVERQEYAHRSQRVRRCSGLKAEKPASFSTSFCADKNKPRHASGGQSRTGRRHCLAKHGKRPHPQT